MSSVAAVVPLRCVPGARSRKPAFFTPSPRRSLYSGSTPRSIRRFRVRAETGSPSNEPEKGPDSAPDENEPTLAGKIFGSYLQLGVWIVVLSFAGYKGLQQAQTDPSSVGLLLAPPAGALFLIISFLVSRFWGKRNEGE